MENEKNKTKSVSVKEQILSHLQSGKTLTGLIALDLFKTISLAVYIHRLRNQGYDIKGEDIETESGKTITKYYIEPEKPIEKNAE